MILNVYSQIIFLKFTPTQLKSHRTTLQLHWCQHNSYTRAPQSVLNTVKAGALTRLFVVDVPSSPVTLTIQLANKKSITAAHKNGRKVTNWAYAFCYEWQVM